MMSSIISRTRAFPRRRGGERGVTLIELMVVIAILAIIASIAVPTYRRYLIRAQRSEAKVAMLQFVTAEEKFYMQNNTFTDKVGDASPTGLGLSTTSETGKYAITAALSNGGQAYIATATPVTGGGQADDKECTTYTVDQKGTKGNTGTKGPEVCWR